MSRRWTRPRAELLAWLKADPRHRQYYEEAHRTWLGAALLPPTDSWSSTLR